MLKSSDNTVPFRKSRRCGPKVKTGCITCKIRRVKCDEEHPSCKRCTSTGRKCDGYLDRPVVGKQRTRDVQNTALLQDPMQQLVTTESRCFVSMSKISCVFGDDPLWLHDIVYLAVQEDAVRSALFALDMIQQREQEEVAPSNDFLSLQAYHKAIQALSSYSSRREAMDNAVILVICLLFVGIEFAKGDANAGLRHIKGGITLIESKNYSHILNLVPAVITQFSRLGIQSGIYEPTLFFRGRPLSLTRENTSSGIPIFSTLSEVRITSQAISSSALAFIGSLQLNGAMFGVAPINHLTINTQTTLLQQIELWHLAFDAFCYTEQFKWNKAELLMAWTAKMQGITTSLWLSTCLVTEQSEFDKLENQFEEIAKLAEKCLSYSLITPFRIDMGLIPVLHFVGVKCRLPRIRRRILAILASKHWREGLYDSFISYRIVHRQMQIEEEGLDMQNYPHSLPEESSRIYASSLSGLLDAAIEYPFFNLQLVLFPRGKSNGHKIRIERIPLKGELPTF